MKQAILCGKLLDVKAQKVLADQVILLEDDKI